MLLLISLLFPFYTYPPTRRHSQLTMAAPPRSRLGLPCLVLVVTLMCGSCTRASAGAFKQPPHLALARRLFGPTGCGAVAFQHSKHLYARQRRSSSTVAFAAADGSSSSAPVKTPPPPAAYKPKVWAYYRSRSKIIEWYLQELGVAYDAVQVDMGTMGHKDPDFIRDVNPFGKQAWGEGEGGCGKRASPN